MNTSKNILLFLFLVFTAFQSEANADSLAQVFQAQKGELKLYTGLQLCDALVENPDSFYAFSHQLLTYAEKQEAKGMLLAKVFRSVSDACFFIDSFQQSFAYAQKAIAIAESITPPDSQFIGGIYNDAGYTLQELQNRGLSAIFLKKAISYLSNTPYLTELADAISNLATLYHSEGKYEEAIELYKQVFELDVKTGNKNSQSSSLNSLGRIYVDWGKYQTGLEYYLRSIELLDSVQDSRMLGVRYNNIGMVYQIMARHKEAIEWIEKARIIEEPFGASPRLATRYFNLGNSYMALKQRDKANDMFTKAEAIFLPLGMNPQLSKVYGSIGQLYSNKKELDKAEDYLMKSKDYAEKSSSLPELSSCYKHLYEFYKDAGKHKEALLYHELHNQAEDSIYNQNASKLVEELNAQYQTQQKEAEIARLESENTLNRREIQFRKRERNFAMAGIFGLLLVAAGMFLLLRTVKKQEQKLAFQNSELDKLNKTLNHLFAIISHDLRNATAAYKSSAKVIRHHLEKGQSDKLLPITSEIQANAENLSAMLENLLQWSVLQLKGVEPKKELIHLRAETERIAEQFTDEAKKKGNALLVDIPEDSIAWCDKESYALILRNLVGNALKFTSNGKVNVSASQSDGHIVLAIQDNGIGISDATKATLLSPDNKKVRAGTHGEKGTGLGLMMVAEHVEKNGGSLSIESNEGKGSIFLVQLPTKN